MNDFHDHILLTTRQEHIILLQRVPCVLFVPVRCMHGKGIMAVSGPVPPKLRSFDDCYHPIPIPNIVVIVITTFFLATWHGGA